MKYYIKHSTGFLALLFIFLSNAEAADLILPLPKPTVDKEIRILVKNKKNIYPQKRPLTIKTKNLTSDKTDQIEEVKKTESKENIFIYPKKKPIVIKKTLDKAVTNSTVFSKKDFKIAKNVFSEIKNNKWQTALKDSKKAKDKSLYKLVNYLYLKKPSNAASFNDYSSFIIDNPDFPRISRLRYLAEHKINFNATSHKSIIKWFGGSDPLSNYGKIKLGEIYLLQGDAAEGSKLIKEGWIQAKLSKANLRFYRKKYKKIITVEDNIKRADWHAWEGKYWDVQRMLRYLPKDYTELYRARQLLMSRSYGVDSAISKIPNKFKNDIGLQYDRLKWRRRRGRLDSSLEILFQTPADPDKLVRPEIWWKERAILSRSLIYKKKYSLAYKVSSNHSMKDGPEYAEAEWLSGWIALTFLEDPNMALEHFNNFYNNVGYPISLSRGA